MKEFKDHKYVVHEVLNKRNCQYKKMFLDWFNNFLSLPCFAEHYGISTKKARQIIRKGEALHESNFGSILEWKE